ncbi:FRK2 [Linum grandiflorum]
MLIDFVPIVSGVSLAEAPGFLKAPSGAPANVAIDVSKLGGKSAFVGELGDDEFGHMLAGILKEKGVIGDGINFDKGARTALALVTLKADGDREFMFFRNPSADMLLQPEELNLKLIRSVSDVELEFLTGSDKIDDASAMSLWHDNLKLLLVTLGEKGCNYYTKVPASPFSYPLGFRMFVFI